MKSVRSTVETYITRLLNVRAPHKKKLTCCEEFARIETFLANSPSIIFPTTTVVFTSLWNDYRLLDLIQSKCENAILQFAPGIMSLAA